MSGIRLAPMMLRTILIGVGTLWAALLLVVGYAVLVSGGSGGVADFWLGLASFSGGQFILMYVVADHLIRVRDRRFPMALQMLASVTFLVSCSICVALLVFPS
ncbi:MAG: hypothetical protein AAGB34_02365 [Planctomycetota bacterium]